MNAMFLKTMKFFANFKTSKIATKKFYSLICKLDKNIFYN